jgi:uncharacterized phage-associated protein
MNRQDAHDPLAVANKVLELCDEARRPVTIMKLIKLVYLADGWSMALRGEPLVSQAPQAWQHGPVYPTIYRALNHFGSARITAPATIPGTDIPVAEEFSEDELALMRQVISSYGKYHAFSLSEIMHRDGTPWSETIKSRGKYAEIPLNVIADHFRKIRDERRVAAHRP